MNCPGSCSLRARRAPSVPASRAPLISISRAVRLGQDRRRAVVPAKPICRGSIQVACYRLVLCACADNGAAPVRRHVAEHRRHQRLVRLPRATVLLRTYDRWGCPLVHARNVQPGLWTSSSWLLTKPSSGSRRCTEFKADFGHVVLAAKASSPGSHTSVASLTETCVVLRRHNARGRDDMNGVAHRTRCNHEGSADCSPSH